MNSCLEMVVVGSLEERQEEMHKAGATSGVVKYIHIYKLWS